jgi:protein AFG1
MRGALRCSTVIRHPQASRPLTDSGRYTRAFRTSATPHALRTGSCCRKIRPELAIQGANLSTSCPNRSRSMATVVDAEPVHGGGPIPEYDRRVAAGRLRNDEHQRGEHSWNVYQIVSKSTDKVKELFRTSKTFIMNWKNMTPRLLSIPP